MDNNFEKSLEKILNIDLDQFQEQVNKVRKINVQKTIDKLKTEGKTNSPFYESLLAIKDIDFEEYQNCLMLSKIWD